MTHDRLNRAARASPFHWRSSGGASLRPAPLTTQACAAPGYASSRGSVAPCFLALALLSPRAVGRDEAECAVEGAPEGAGVAAGLGEDEPALEAGFLESHGLVERLAEWQTALDKLELENTGR